MYLMINNLSMKLLLTCNCCIATLGLAESYKRNKTFTPIPIIIPYSRLIKRQQKNVQSSGIKSNPIKRKSYNNNNI